jgi:hypothetical protein
MEGGKKILRGSKKTPGPPRRPAGPRVGHVHRRLGPDDERAGRARVRLHRLGAGGEVILTQPCVFCVGNH